MELKDFKEQMEPEIYEKLEIFIKNNYVTKEKHVRNVIDSIIIDANNLSVSDIVNRLKNI